MKTSMGDKSDVKYVPCTVQDQMVQNVAALLHHHLVLMASYSKAVCGAQLVDGLPFWQAVAKAAVALGATAEPLVLYGPVESPPAGQKKPAPPPTKYYLAEEAPLVGYVWMGGKWLPPTFMGLTPVVNFTAWVE